MPGELLFSPVQVNWTPAPFSQLNFTNTTERCDLGALWVAEGARVIATRGGSKTTTGSVVDYLDSILPDDSRNVFTGWNPAAKTGALITWYEDMGNTAQAGNESALHQLWGQMFAFPETNCSMAICTKLDWEGDPDISGVGVGSLCAV